MSLGRVHHVNCPSCKKPLTAHTFTRPVIVSCGACNVHLFFQRTERGKLKGRILRTDEEMLAAVRVVGRHADPRDPLT